MEGNSTMSDLTPRRKILFIVSSLLFLAVFVIIISEIILRLKGVQPWQRVEVNLKVNPEGNLYINHPTLGYTNRPGRFTITLPDGYSFVITNLPDSQRITHPLNTYGASGRKDEIWIFGCSLTYGWSLNDQETFPWLLQERFPHYEVVNFGVNGYGTVQSLIQFREALARGRVPKAVLLNFASFHDERNILSRNRRKAIISSKSFGQVFHPYARLGPNGELNYYPGEINFRELPLMRYSALMNFVEEKYDKIEEHYYHITDVTKAILLEFANTAKNQQIPVVIAGITFGKPTRDMLSFVREKGFKTVDIGLDLNIKKNTNYPHDGHPGPLANREYADKLEVFLRADVLQ